MIRRRRCVAFALVALSAFVVPAVVSGAREPCISGGADCGECEGKCCRVAPLMCGLIDMGGMCKCCGSHGCAVRAHSCLLGIPIFGGISCVEGPPR